MAENIFPYNFAIETIEHLGKTYRVAMTPELGMSEGELDFTGNWECLMIGEPFGTLYFTMEPDHHTRWNLDTKKLDLGLIDKLDEIIQKHRNG